MADRIGAKAMDPLQLPVQGTVVVFVFLLLGAGKAGTLPLALATTVLVSPWFVRVKTMWRQAPITARFWLMKPPPRAGTWPPDAGRGVPDGSKAMGTRIGLPQRRRGPQARAGTQAPDSSQPAACVAPAYCPYRTGEVHPGGRVH